ncbi:hypothetical protein [Streptomyces sp. NPDC059411]|uniref:hypothetical protein n=1 Tax=Streptomyces sp. NPDC059411 TaxID=3346825 RepID=UPI00368B331B
MIGLCVRADNLTAAESHAARLCRRVLEREEFAAWSLVLAEVPTVALFYESMLTGFGLAAERVDGTGQGRLRPGRSSSTPSDQQRE